MVDQNIEVIAKVGKTYKAVLRVATSPYSYIEVDVDSTMDDILAKQDYLTKHYNGKNV